jgi:UDP-N-acetyl-D-glucosamine dehydrogenase
MSQLEKKIKDREAVIGVVGLGYVGLPLILAFGRQGFRLIGFDVDEDKITKLGNGESYIKHIPGAEIGNLVKNKLFHATSDFSEVSHTDIIIICVPTPLTIHRNPELKYIESTGVALYPHLQKDQLVILESTTYPGTTDEVLLPILEKSGLTAGDDFLIAYSPEREDPGNVQFDIASTPKVVGGHSPLATETACSLYKFVAKDVVPVNSMKVAEACKILENIYRSVNIALVNELKVLFNKMDIDIWEVIRAAKTKPFGYQAFYPGPGLGGHCIPIDPFYLTWKAKEYDMSTRFIELAGEVNSGMPTYVIQQTMEGLNGIGKAMNKSKVLLLGMAYKKDVDDIRESPSLEILKHLQGFGALCSYFDPHVAHLPKLRNYDFNLASLTLSEIAKEQFDVGLILTDHTDVDYQTILDRCSLVVDTRNVTGNLEIKHDHVIKA